MEHLDTIAALSTPPGSGAIALLRVSGRDTLRIVHAVAPALPDELRARHAYYAAFHDAEGPVDEGVLTLFKGPNSYTGEDLAEFTVHGSTYVQQRLMEALLNAGARTALPGEFTQRAFLNRKMDLSQAEAVADLIASQSAAQHRLALQQLRGGFGERIEELRQQLIDFAALIELELDFSEEDVEFAQRIELRALLDRLVDLCTELIESFRYGNAIKQGIPVAILGAPNSGKSTLLNALLQEDRAIVSDIPGTTRDTVEETMTIGGVLFRFIDTAGLRKTTDTVEQLGIERSYKKAQAASIVVLLGDASRQAEGALLTEASFLEQRIGAGPTVIPVLNKCDVPGVAPTKGTLSISARDGTGLPALKKAFTDHVDAL
ncbi:MAG: tRNA uridine-5-carboxymethylaminomethyl(34) synthesis GTPase MnmE, partial [Flavobacteriales bacterium]|nr:tRNA uridine-5-carboxymethylaminomethyl(34) synthesis GTPase MnmE [Flavobacteriales bacterium]